MLSTPATGDDVGFVVIVNTTNPVASVSRSELADIFLKQLSAWPDGQVILPVDQAESSSVRADFSRVVLKRPVAAVKSFWQKQIFSGSAVPPIEKRSNADVVAYVSAFHGAVGYVAPTGKVPPGTKIVRLAD
jgi:ABC-type phosphate transport system substrate-binding protein